MVPMIAVCRLHIYIKMFPKASRAIVGHGEDETCDVLDQNFGSCHGLFDVCTRMLTLRTTSLLTLCNRHLPGPFVASIHSLIVNLRFSGQSGGRHKPSPDVSNGTYATRMFRRHLRYASPHIFLCTPPQAAVRIRSIAASCPTALLQ